MNMGVNGNSIYNENDELIAQDVAHPESGNTNVEFINNVNSNTNNSLPSRLILNISRQVINFVNN